MSPNPDPGPYDELLFFKEDVEVVQSAMKEIAAINQLEVTILADAWGHCLCAHGDFPTWLLEETVDRVRQGTIVEAVSLGSSVFAVGLRAEKAVALSGAPLETLRKLLRGLKRKSEYFREIEGGASP